MYQTKIVEKIKTHILCLVTISRKTLRLWDDVGKFCRAGQATVDNMTLNKRRLQTHTRNTLYLLLLRRKSSFKYVHCLFWYYLAQNHSITMLEEPVTRCCIPTTLPPLPAIFKATCSFWCKDNFTSSSGRGFSIRLLFPISHYKILYCG